MQKRGLEATPKIVLACWIVKWKGKAGIVKKSGANSGYPIRKGETWQTDLDSLLIQKGLARIF
jgi:hypothetical protein